MLITRWSVHLDLHHNDPLDDVEQSVAFSLAAIGYVPRSLWGKMKGRRLGVELFLFVKSLRKTKAFPGKTLKTMVFGSLGICLLDIYVVPVF